MTVASKNAVTGMHKSYWISFFYEKSKNICQFEIIDISLHRKNAMAR